MKHPAEYKFGKIPWEYQQVDVRWLRIVPAKPPDSGVFIWMYENLPDGVRYDDWCQTMELALERAEKIYGVSESDLMTIDEVRALGIDIAD